MAKKQSAKEWLPRLIYTTVLRITVAVSFVMIPISLGFTIYYSLVSFDFYKSLIGCALLFATPYVNIKIQGAK